MAKAEEKIEKIRHSLSHLMSMAVQELYPNVGLGVGPTIENGFYQDYDLPAEASAKEGLPTALTPEILPKLEKRMRELIKENIKFEQHDMDFDEALKLYKNDPYKTELIKDLKESGESKVSFYKSSEFDNLCAGPHVSSTKEIDPNAFKLTHIAGAYWRGDEKNKMLTRIYGLAFESKEELLEYLKNQEEAKKRDHRVIGKDLGLFVFSDLVGKGLPTFGPKGATIKRILERFTTDEELKRGYHHVITPDLAKVDLYKKSGHYPYYKDTMYPVMKIDEEELILRPMTCPHHFMFYKSEPHSYRDLPYRIGEIAHQYRYEKSGELSGLTRVRMFCLADAHIITAKGEAKQVIKEVLELIDFINNALGITKGVDYRYRLSLGDRSDTKKYYKDDASWDYAENVLREVLTEVKAPFYEATNEAAFYGPKIDIQVKRASDNEETAFTVQYDFVMPERFDLSFTNKEGKPERPIVVHRSSIGCLERTMAFLIEHYAGNFPLWLSPVQVKVIPVRESHNEYAKEVYEMLKENDIRVEVDLEDENLGKKVRAAKNERIPYWIVLGDKEVASKEVTVEARGADGEGQKLGSLSPQKFLELLQKQIKEKK
ncbi:MAG: threonine--tRNA ligase [Candidatus Zambryskibacteria bacterium]